jgi:hypothetical protein
MVLMDGVFFFGNLGFGMGLTVHRVVEIATRFSTIVCTTLAHGAVADVSQRPQRHL